VPSPSARSGSAHIVDASVTKSGIINMSGVACAHASSMSRPQTVAEQG
jgi:hypothetical protein